MKMYAIEFKRNGKEDWIETIGIYKNIEDAKKAIKEMKYNDFKAHDEDGYEYRIIERYLKKNVTLTETVR